MEPALSLAGKTALVTGATAGLGLATARALAQQGAHVVVAGREAAKAERVAAELRALPGAGPVDVLVGDLGSLASVRAMAADFDARFPALHVLVNNAGAFFLERGVSADGYELTLAVNHLGPYLLTRLLLPALERGAPARVVNVSSDGHRVGRVDFEDLQLERGWASFTAYAASKLMNVLFTRELARRLEGKGVTVNALHPGAVASDFMKKPGWKGAVGSAVLSVFGVSPEKAARTSVFLASAPEVAGVTGRYFANVKEKAPAKAALDDEVARRLWAVSERLVGLAG